MTDEAVDPYLLGLHDAVISGWYNNSNGELAPGFGVSSADIVVDVGCGDGGAAAFCARQGAHVILADMDAERLAGTLERLRESGARQIDAHVTAADPLPLPDETASRIVCTEVLEHVDDPRTFMAELVRVGQPGALYLITVPGAAQEYIQKDLAPPQYFERPNHIRIIEKREFHDLVEASGLKILHESQYGFYWSIWFAFFWQTGTPIGGSDPTLQLWAELWSKVLAGRDGHRIKCALDAALPKAQVVVARKSA